MKRKRTEWEKGEADRFWERYKDIAGEDTEILKKTSIGQSTLSTWRKMHRFPGADDAVKIARVLNKTVEWLVTGEDATGITQSEQSLLDVFRLLDLRDQEDIIGTIQGKIERAKKGDILSSSENA